jgi:hypothetical protein
MKFSALQQLGHPCLFGASSPSVPLAALAWLEVVAIVLIAALLFVLGLTLAILSAARRPRDTPSAQSGLTGERSLGSAVEATDKLNDLMLMSRQLTMLGLTQEEVWVACRMSITRTPGRLLRHPYLVLERDAAGDLVWAARSGPERNDL